MNIDFFLPLTENVLMPQKKAEVRPDLTQFTQISIRIPTKLLWDIEALAAKENRNRNNMIEQLLFSAVDAATEPHDLSQV